jgi:FixJ family two-component response regulator
MTTNGSGIVVVVEDDPSIRRAMERMLRLAGFTTAIFGSAEELLENGRLPVNALCMIIDVQLPGMNGFALHERLAEDDRLPFPVIFMTAFDDEVTRMRVTESGALGFLSKPFTGEALLDTIAMVSTPLPRRSVAD